MNRIKLIVVLSVFCSFIASFQPQTAFAQKGCTQKNGTFQIAWIPKALNNIVFDIGQTGAETRAAQLSQAGGCNVKVFVAAPMNAIASEQTDLLRQIIKQSEVNAIGISCIDPDACIAPINEAVDAGIPIMTWDSDSPQSKRFTYLGINNFEAGKTAADLLVRTMGSVGKVGILSGVKGSLNLEQRVQGFTDALKQYPNIKIGPVLYGNDEAVDSARLVEDYSKANRDLTGWFFAGLWPFTMGKGAMPTWEQATISKTIVNIAIDTLPIELDLMKEGYIQGLVGQKYWGWGYDTVTILYNHVVNGVQYDQFVDSGIDVVTINNMDAMAKAWETKDFSQTLPPPFLEATQSATASATEAAIPVSPTSSGG